MMLLFWPLFGLSAQGPRLAGGYGKGCAGRCVVQLHEGALWLLYSPTCTTECRCNVVPAILVKCTAGLLMSPMSFAVGVQLIFAVQLFCPTLWCGNPAVSKVCFGSSCATGSECTEYQATRKCSEAA